MAQRTDRSSALTDDVRKRISSSMINYHKNKGVEAAQKRARKQSESMKNYWAHIPPQTQVTMDDLVL